MNDVDKFNDLINTSAKVELCLEKYEKFEVRLQEAKKEDSFVYIKGIPKDSIIFNVDDFFPAPDKIFSGKHGECCRGDYVLITDDNGDKRIILIELKSDECDMTHIKQQFKGLISFLYYCKEILNQFFGYEFKISSYRIHYVLCKKSCRKGPIRQAIPQSSNTNLEHILKLVGNSSFRYNKLILKK